MYVVQDSRCIDRGALFAIDGVRFHQAFGELKSRRTMLEHRLCDLDPGLCFIVRPPGLFERKRCNLYWILAEGCRRMEIEIVMLSGVCFCLCLCLSLRVPQHHAFSAIKLYPGLRSFFSRGGSQSRFTLSLLSAASKHLIRT